MNNKLTVRILRNHRDIDKEVRFECLFQLENSKCDKHQICAKYVRNMFYSIYSLALIYIVSDFVINVVK